MGIAGMTAAAVAALGLAVGSGAALAAAPGHAGDQPALAAFSTVSPLPSGNWVPPGPPSPHHWYPPARRHHWYPPAHHWNPPAHHWYPPAHHWYPPRHRPPVPPGHPHPGH